MNPMKRFFLLSLACAVSGVLLAADSAVVLSTDTPLLTGWRFHLGDLSGAERPDFDDAGWEEVRIPHDWAITGPFDVSNDLQVTRIVQDGEQRDKRHTGRTGGLPWPGTGWYRRRLSLPADTQYAELVFEGAMAEPVVYADGVQVGEWKNGYNSFIVPIPANTRQIAVRLHNPPASSRWYPGSGLIRPVRLVTGGATAIKTWGNFIRTLSLDSAKAELAVSTRVRSGRPTSSPLPGEKSCRVAWTLRVPNGSPAATASAPIVDGVAEGKLLVDKPLPWSPERPDLYRLETVLMVDGQLVDRRQDRVGVRTACFTRDGFFLNGVRRPFRGVCLHHDLGPIGAAFNTAAFRRQLRLLKELGVDAIRTSHNMPSPEQMDLCDEMGLMVMAESFDAWMSPKIPNDYSRHFRAWWRRDLENLITCHRSHPSIVMWSIGNEVHEKDAEAVRDFAKALTDCCHRLDPSRPVVFVTDRPDAYAASGAIQATDVPALTYRLPRYSFMHDHSPIGLVLGAETASTFSSRGAYHFPAEVGVNAEHSNGQASSYDLEHGSWSNLPDDDWAMQDDHPWAIGEFVWTGFDYLGEPTPYKEYWPSRSSYFGIFDLAGLPKDRYWLYRTRWNASSPTLHLLPHWTWPGREGLVTPVYCYTTYPEAELFVNGRSQGRRRFNPASRLDRYRLRWNDVVYQPGEIKVVAYDADGRRAAERTVRTAGAPHHLELVADRAALAAPSPCETPDLAFVTVRVVDAAGNLCPDADVRLDFSARGAVCHRAACNGDATSLELFHLPTMRAFHGQLVVVVEACEVGVGELVVSSKGLPSASLPFKVSKQ